MTNLVIYRAKDQNLSPSVTLEMKIGKLRPRGITSLMQGPISNVVT